jgi:regulatory protein
VHVVRVRAIARDPLVRHVDIAGVGRFRLTAETVSSLGLVDGVEIDAARARRVARAAEQWDARAFALRLLQRRLRSRVELEKALWRRGVPRPLVLAVVADLTRVGWIDDSLFARAWLRDRLSLRPSGRKRLRSELLARGVAPAVADAALIDLLPPEDEEALAIRQARLRWQRLRALPPAMARRRLAGWLRRRGYGLNVMARALRLPDSGLLDSSDADPAI